MQSHPGEMASISIDQAQKTILISSPYLRRSEKLFTLLEDGKANEAQAIQASPVGARLEYSLGGQACVVQVEWKVGADQAEISVILPVGCSSSTVELLPLKAFSLAEGEQSVNLNEIQDSRGRLAVYRSEPGEVQVRLAEGGYLLIHSHEGKKDSLQNEPAQEQNRTVLSLMAGKGGWREAFAALRKDLRQTVELAEYEREDSKWYADQYVQHFTFLYGREILDLDEGEFNIDRFLDEGERDFGGYDGFLIWGVYPRIGVDERTQWDFYDDFPGGRQGLLAMSRRARERGVRFFLPYKPWDRSLTLHGQEQPPDHEELARLIGETEADGVFLDTMDLVSKDFRESIDRVKSGVVFCSEGRARGAAREIITGCWVQSPNRGQGGGNWSASVEPMPVIDLWRFILPEHKLFVISRHTMGDDRMRIIQRGFLNGMGWVVWQDIFGLVLPFAPAEAALLKKCRNLFREHSQVINSASPTPLLPEAPQGIWMNEFSAGGKRLWTLYNEKEQELRDVELDLNLGEGCHFVDIWNQSEVRAPGGKPRVCIGARQVGALVEFPRMLLVENREVQVDPRAGDCQIRVETAALTQDYAPGAGATFSLPVATGKTVIKLIRDGEVLDMFIAGETS